MPPIYKDIYLVYGQNRRFRNRRSQNRLSRVSVESDKKVLDWFFSDVIYH